MSNVSVYLRRDAVNGGGFLASGSLNAAWESSQNLTNLLVNFQDCVHAA